MIILKVFLKEKGYREIVAATTRYGQYYNATCYAGGVGNMFYFAYVTVRSAVQLVNRNLPGENIIFFCSFQDTAHGPITLAEEI